jgi:hypothetical protein
LQNVYRRLKPLLDQRPVEMQLRVPGALNFKINSSMRLPVSINAVARIVRSATFFDVARRAEKFLWFDERLAPTPPDMIWPLPVADCYSRVSA